MFKCKYCGKEFESKQKLGGHVTTCKLNPNYLKNKENIIIARKHITYNYNTSEKYFCRYCNKEIGNKGCLVLHEKRCKFNPNYKPTDKQLEKQNKIKTKKVLSEEHKQKIRESLQRWKEENKELFLNYSRKKSICCENFKKYLRDNNIDFVEEYSPYYKERLYSLDIAFPDEKIAIEINGSQHYNEYGELNEYTLNKQKFFEERGWKIIQIYYKWCYGVISNNEQINSIFDLPIHNKSYVKDIYTIKYQKKLEKEKQYQIKMENNNEIDKFRKNILYKMLYESSIDFSKSGWNKQCIIFLQENNYPYITNIFRQIKHFFPEFLKDASVWKRKGSIY